MLSEERSKFNKEYYESHKEMIKERRRFRYSSNIEVERKKSLERYHETKILIKPKKMLEA